MQLSLSKIIEKNASWCVALAFGRNHRIFILQVKPELVLPDHMRNSEGQRGSQWIRTVLEGGGTLIWRANNGYAEELQRINVGC